MIKLNHRLEAGATSKSENRPRGVQEGGDPLSCESDTTSMIKVASLNRLEIAYKRLQESAMPAIDPRSFIRDVPDFPKPGILFKDITPLLGHAEAFQAVIDGLAEYYRGKPVDVVAAAEARGFIFGAPLALALGLGFVPIRKPGKLPYDKIEHEYQLEYGTDRLEMHRDAVLPGQKVLLIDDVLATGGTIGACKKLVESTGAEVVSCGFAVELGFLGGREKLKNVDIFSFITY